MSDYLKQRAQRAAESILENEALTAELDDDAAKELLDWGVSLAQQIAAATIEMDEAAAEEAMHQPLRALRRMLKQTGQWIAAPDQANLDALLGQAALVYGDRLHAPTGNLKTAFLANLPASPAEKIQRLRRLLGN
jgi:FAD/FMN-containing dehydrogenase